MKGAWASEGCWVRRLGQCREMRMQQAPHGGGGGVTNTLTIRAKMTAPASLSARPAGRPERCFKWLGSPGADSVQSFGCSAFSTEQGPHREQPRGVWLTAHISRPVVVVQLSGQ